MPFISWCKIQHFNNIPHKYKKGVVKYKAKVKLHGTNAGIIIKRDGTVIAQSRTRVIDITHDNYDFAKYVFSESNKLSALKSDNDIIIFGEWCGNGVQSGVAISQVGHRFFAVFAVLYLNQHGDSTIETEPSVIENLLSPLNMDNLYIIPWLDDICFNVDFEKHPKDINESISFLNDIVDSVEKCDPFAKSLFNIDGIGEGLVLYPQTSSYKIFSELSFKAKGELHRTSACKKPVQASADISNEIEFVRLVLTESRLNQGALQVLGESMIFNKLFIKEFIDWIVNDIITECAEELSFLDIKFVKRELSKMSGAWFCRQVK